MGGEWRRKCFRCAQSWRWHTRQKSIKSINNRRNDADSSSSWSSSLGLTRLSSFSPSFSSSSSSFLTSSFSRSKHSCVISLASSSPASHVPSTPRTLAGTKSFKSWMSSKKRFSSSSSHLPPLTTISSSPPNSWLEFEQMRMESDFCDVVGSEGGGRQSSSDNLRLQLNCASLLYRNHSRLTA